jgi:aminoglycoside 3-N-acetyltransferase
MTESDVVAAHQDKPVTQEAIAEDLSALGLGPGDLAIVHTRLSALGWVCGGPVAVIKALQECVRSYGTIVMPTHSGDLSDPQLWENPPVPRGWWQTIRDTMPAYEPEVTPTRGVGRTPELFRTLPDVVRSAHPHVSFAAWGERAVDVVSDHPLEFCLGDDSPLGRLYDLDGRVLMLGAPFDSCTIFHLAEYRADYRTKDRVLLGAPVFKDGHRRWKTFTDINYSSDDFGEIGRAFLKSHEKEVRTGRVGAATAHLFSVRLAVDFAAKWLHSHRT